MSKGITGIKRASAPTEPCTPTLEEWEAMDMAIDEAAKSFTSTIAVRKAHTVMNYVKAYDSLDAYIVFRDFPLVNQKALRKALKKAGFVLDAAVDTAEGPGND